MYPMRLQRYLLTRKKPVVIPAPETTMDIARQLIAEHGRDGVLKYLKREGERLERNYQINLAKLFHLRGESPRELQSPGDQQFTAKFPNELPPRRKVQTRDLH